MTLLEIIALLEHAKKEMKAADENCTSLQIAPATDNDEQLVLAKKELERWIEIVKQLKIKLSNMCDKEIAPRTATKLF